MKYTLDREPVVQYIVQLDMRINTKAPYRTILDLVKEVRSELIGKTSAGGVDDEKNVKFIFEGDKLFVKKSMDWSAEFTIDWNKAGLSRIIKEYGPVIVDFDFCAWKKQYWVIEEEIKDAHIIFEHPKCKAEPSNDIRSQEGGQ